MASKNARRYQMNGFIAGIAVLLLTVCAVVMFHRQSHEAETWTTHARKVRGEIDRLALSLAECELATRDTLRSGGVIGQEARESACPAIDTSFARLRDLVAENPDQAERTARLALAVAEKKDQLTDLQQRQQGPAPLSALEAYVLSNDRKDAGQAIELELNAMRQDEKVMLGEHLLRYHRESNRLLIAVIAGGLLACTLLILSAIHQSMANSARSKAQERLAASERQLSRLTNELEQRVQERTRSLKQEVEERRRVQDSLLRKEGELRLITDMLPAAVIYIDDEERHRFCNPQYERWVKRNQAELFGQTLGEVLGPESSATTLQHLRQAMQGQAFSFDAYLPFPDQGRHVHVEVVPDLCGQQTRGCVLMISDVSAAIAINAELQSAKAAAEAANQAKSLFLASMSHELRTPLGVILGYADVLMGRDLAASERVRLAGIIQRNGENLLALVNDILDLSKVEQHRLQVELTTFALPIFIDDIISQVKLKADEKALAFSWSARSPIPETITSDAVRLRQILLNLITNAIKFTQAGSVHLSVTLEEEDGGHFINFVVSDTGIGIPEENHDRLFQPFVQADSSITRKYGGTGLGLSLSLQLAKLLGGSVSLLASQPGRGSSFLATIAAGSLQGVKQVTLRDAGCVMRHRGEVEKKRSTAKIDLHGVRILLAEDFEDNQALFCAMLEDSGAQVDVVVNGLEAVTQASQQAYDIVLMDMQMPVMDGYQATSTLRANGFEKPIIALTANAMMGEKEKCLAAGCSEFLSKPIDRLTLVTLVRSSVAATQQGPSPLMQASLVSDRRDDPAVAKALPHFLSQLDQRLASLESMYEAADRIGMQRLAHQLKGAGASFGFPAITAAAALIADGGEQAEDAKLEAALLQLKQLASLISRGQARYH